MAHARESESCSREQMPDLPSHVRRIGTIGTTGIPSKFVRVGPRYWSKETKIAVGNDVCSGFSLYSISVIVPIAPFTRPVATQRFAINITCAFLANNISGSRPFAVSKSAFEASEPPV